jgi:hypothetical protein
MRRCTPRRRSFYVGTLLIIFAILWTTPTRVYKSFVNPLVARFELSSFQLYVLHYKCHSSFGFCNIFSQVWNNQVHERRCCVCRLRILLSLPKSGHTFKARLCEDETCAASGLSRIASGWSLLLIADGGSVFVNPSLGNWNCLKAVVDD